MLVVVLTRAARIDLDDAAVRYEEQRAGLGLRFTSAVDQTIAQVAGLPLRFPLAHGNARCARVHRFPYSVLFQPEHFRVVVFAIYHVRRDPAGWKSRLGR